MDRVGAFILGVLAGALAHDAKFTATWYYPLTPQAASLDERRRFRVRWVRG